MKERDHQQRAGEGMIDAALTSLAARGAGPDRELLENIYAQTTRRREFVAEPPRRRTQAPPERASIWWFVAGAAASLVVTTSIWLASAKPKPAQQAAPLHLVLHYSDHADELSPLPLRPVNPVATATLQGQVALVDTLDAYGVLPYLPLPRSGPREVDLTLDLATEAVAGTSRQLESFAITADRSVTRRDHRIFWGHVRFDHPEFVVEADKLTLPVSSDESAARQSGSGVVAENVLIYQRSSGVRASAGRLISDATLSTWRLENIISLETGHDIESLGGRSSYQMRLGHQPGRFVHWSDRELDNEYETF